MNRQKKVIAGLLLLVLALSITTIVLFVMLRAGSLKTGESARFADEMAKVQDELKDEKARNDTLTEEIGAVRSELETAKDEADSKTLELQKANEQIRELGDRVAALTGEDSIAVISGDGVSAHGALHYEGSRLIDENGVEMRLTGVSTHGLLWFYEYANAGAMKTVSQYGANTVRIAMYSDDGSGGYVQNREMSTKLMYSAIENARAQDMYVIVDWHVLNDQDPNRNTGAAMEFFNDISSRYGDDPAIIYEICNEPNGDGRWDAIKNYANQVIPCIRNNAPSAVIIVGTPDYSYAVTAVIGDELQYDNLAYSFHYYAGQHGEDYENMIGDCLRNDIPVFVSEWGVNRDMGGDEALAKAQRFIDYMDSEKISWCSWSLCNKDECFSFIKPDCRKYSDWKEEDLTDVGKLIFKSFK